MEVPTGVRASTSGAGELGIGAADERAVTGSMC